MLPIDGHLGLNPGIPILPEARQDALEDFWQQYLIEEARQAVSRLGCRPTKGRELPIEFSPSEGFQIGSMTS